MSPNLLSIQTEPVPRSDLSTLIAGPAASGSSPSPLRDFAGFLRDAMGAGGGNSYASRAYAPSTALASEQPNRFYDPGSRSAETATVFRTQEGGRYGSGTAGGATNSATASQPEAPAREASASPRTEDSQAMAGRRTVETPASSASDARSSESAQSQRSGSAGASDGQPDRVAADPASAKAAGEPTGNGPAASETSAAQAAKGGSERSALLEKAKTVVEGLAATLGLSADQKQALLREIAAASAKTLKRLIAGWNLLRAEMGPGSKARALEVNASDPSLSEARVKKQAVSAVQQAIHALLAGLGLHIPAAHDGTQTGAPLLAAGGPEPPLPGGGRENAGAAAVHPNASSHTTTTVVDLRGSSGSQTQAGGSGSHQPGAGPGAEGGSGRLIQVVTADLQASGTARAGSASSQLPAAPSGPFQQQFQTIANQLVRQTGILLKDSNAGEIRLLLKPENLGSVRIRIDLVDNSLTGKILVDNSQVAKVIQQNLDALYQGFRESGFTQTSLSVSVGGRHAGDREKGRNSPLPMFDRITGARSLEGSVPSIDFLGNAYSLVNLVV